MKHSKIQTFLYFINKKMSVKTNLLKRGVFELCKTDGVLVLLGPRFTSGINYPILNTNYFKKSNLKNINKGSVFKTNPIEAFDFYLDFYKLSVINEEVFQLYNNLFYFISALKKDFLILTTNSDNKIKNSLPIMESIVENKVVELNGSFDNVQCFSCSKIIEAKQLYEKAFESKENYSYLKCSTCENYLRPNINLNQCNDTNLAEILATNSALDMEVLYKKLTNRSFSKSEYDLEFMNSSVSQKFNDLFYSFYQNNKNIGIIEFGLDTTTRPLQTLAENIFLKNSVPYLRINSRKESIVINFLKNSFLDKGIEFNLEDDNFDIDKFIEEAEREDFGYLKRVLGFKVLSTSELLNKSFIKALKLIRKYEIDEIKKEEFYEILTHPKEALLEIRNLI